MNSVFSICSASNQQTDAARDSLLMKKLKPDIFFRTWWRPNKSEKESEYLNQTWLRYFSLSAVFFVTPFREQLYKVTISQYCVWSFVLEPPYGQKLLQKTSYSFTLCHWVSRHSPLYRLINIEVNGSARSDGSVTVLPDVSISGVAEGRLDSAAICPQTAVALNSVKLRYFSLLLRSVSNKPKPPGIKCNSTVCKQFHLLLLDNKMLIQEVKNVAKAGLKSLRRDCFPLSHVRLVQLWKRVCWWCHWSWFVRRFQITFIFLTGFQF